MNINSPESIPAILNSKTDRELANIINTAVAAHGISASWKVSRTVLLRGVLINHIDEMCNDLGFLVSDSGQLVRR